MATTPPTNPRPRQRKGVPIDAPAEVYQRGVIALLEELLAWVTYADDPGARPTSPPR